MQKVDSDHATRQLLAMQLDNGERTLKRVVAKKNRERRGRVSAASAVFKRAYTLPALTLQIELLECSYCRVFQIDVVGWSTLPGWELCKLKTDEVTISMIILT